MNIDSFRITKTKFVATSFSGEGARLYGGRWNSVGTRIVYLAGSLSGATLELLVHTDDYSTITDLYSYIPVGFPEEYVESIDDAALPTNWDSPTPIAATQQMGDAWVSSMSPAVLRVPSAVTSGEKNYLVNPLHPDFPRLIIGHPQEFKVDPRI
ncbi:MAG: RES family NAD+ phosphorylase [Verrucomicrobia bacterium]|jgi:RES domain-containing protein|nr:RES family NAD+ phosphorylase [Verrucomicrobiota bacterium]